MLSLDWVPRPALPRAARRGGARLADGGQGLLGSLGGVVTKRLVLADDDAVRAAELRREPLDAMPEQQGEELPARGLSELPPLPQHLKGDVRDLPLQVLDDDRDVVSHGPQRLAKPRSARIATRRSATSSGEPSRISARPPVSGLARRLTVDPAPTSTAGAATSSSFWVFMTWRTFDTGAEWGASR